MKLSNIFRSAVVLAFVLSMTLSMATITAGAATRTVEQVVSGDSYSAAILSDGTLWTWGSMMCVTEKTGGSTHITFDKNVYEPVQIASDVKDVQLGEYSYGFVKNDGSVWTWGNNSEMDLGYDTGDQAYTLTPRKVEGLSNVRTLKMNDGVYSASFAITNDDKLYVCGTKETSAMLREHIGGSELVYISDPVLLFDGAKKASTYRDSIAVIDIGGKLWTWGRNTNGVCGTGNQSAQHNPVQPVGLENKTFVDVQIDNDRCAALTDNGELWVWGSNSGYWLGIGNSSDNQYTPVQVELPQIKQFYLGLNSFALDVYGQVWGWGENANGQSGQGTFANTPIVSDKTGTVDGPTKSPVLVTGMGGMPSDAAALVTDGNGVVCQSKALMSNGDLWGWGLNNGLLGDAIGPSTSAPNWGIKPLKMTGNVKDAAITSHVALAIKNDGTLWALGTNERGALGVGSEYQYSVKDFTRVYFGDKPAGGDPSGDDSGDDSGSSGGPSYGSSEAPKVGSIFKSNKTSFKVTGSKTVTYSKPAAKKGSVIIPAIVKYKGVTYKVTAIKAAAFKGSKISKVTIGKNVKTIGKKAFYNCKSLKTITIKSKKLTAGTVGAKAFKGTPKKVTVKVPSGKKKAYKKWIYKKGLSKKAKIK